MTPEYLNSVFCITTIWMNGEFRVHDVSSMLDDDVSSYHICYDEGICKNVAAICCRIDIKSEWRTPLKRQWIEEEEINVRDC